MEIKIVLHAGPYHRDKITKKDIQKNIDCIQRAIDGKPFASDFILLIDTMSILEAIKLKLPLE